MTKNNLAKKRTLWHYEAFATQAGKGNPAGVVPDADTLNGIQMQEIAQEVGFNETVFICSSQQGDYRLRYFTPGHEIPLCGHGTIAAVTHLGKTGALNGKRQLQLETKAGMICVAIQQDQDKFVVTMEQARPEFRAFQGDVAALATSLGIQVEELDVNLPILYGSTGTWTLLLPIKDLATFSRMKPQNQLFPQILKENPRCSVHPFCLKAMSLQRDTYSRHFSAAFSGTVEDPVTGTAAGVLGAYLARYVDSDRGEYHFRMEQGQELGRDGEVAVKIYPDAQGWRVFIAGTAIFVKQWEVTNHS